MNTQIATPYTAFTVQPANDLRELNIYDSSYQLSTLEKQLAYLEGGYNTLAAKSFRSARFSLIRQLAENKPYRILSYEPLSVWAEDLAVYKRSKIEIIHAGQYAESSVKEIVRAEKINLVYIASISSDTLSVANHERIISQAHAASVQVVFDNTAGGLGSIARPLTKQADYVLVNTEESLYAKTGIGAYIAEGLAPHNVNALSSSSLLDRLKQKRAHVKKQPFLIPLDEEAIAVHLQKEANVQQVYAKNTFTLAKWLNQVSEIAEVNYAGLKTSLSFDNAEESLLGGYGSVLKFNVWDTAFSHNLLRSFFIAGRPAGLYIHADNELKEFKVIIRSEYSNQILGYFERVFAQLTGELESRQLLKKRLQLEAAVQQLLQSHLN